MFNILCFRDGYYVICYDFKIVDLAEMIKLGIQRCFIRGHLLSHLSKFDQVKFGQIKKQHFDSSIMNSK